MHTFLRRHRRLVLVPLLLIIVFSLVFLDMPSRITPAFSYAALTLELNRALPTIGSFVASQSLYFPVAGSTVPVTAAGEDDLEADPHLVITTDEQTQQLVQPSPEILTAADLDPNVTAITIAPQSAEGYAEYDGVFIHNGTGYEIDTRSYLEADIEYEPASTGAEVIIVHTHASEAYYPDGDDIYTPTDTDRTEDTRYNVVSVGDRLTEVLEAHGIKVRHIREIMDYPSYNGSYKKALGAVEEALAEEPNVRMVLDLHRDAMITSEGITYRTVADVDGKKAAQILLVMGTDAGGLSHPDWRQNLVFATHLQYSINQRYDKLMRPILLAKSRYNQHTTPASMIVEFGTSGNTLQEALYSAELFGEALADFLEPYRE